MKNRSVLLLLLALPLAACGGGDTDAAVEAGASSFTEESGIAKVIPGRPEDDLVGEFSDQPNGEPQIKITKDNGAYAIAIRENDGWSAPEPLDYQMSDAEAQEFFGDDLDKIEAILVNEGGVFIAKVPKGTDLEGMKIDSGYFLFLGFGGGPVYKI